MTRVRIDSGEIDLTDGRIAGADSRLSARELELVRFLVGQDTLVDPATLLVEVWGYRPDVKSRTVYSTVARIRKKIEVEPTRPRHLLAVDGGYCFVPASSELVPPEGTFGRQRDLSRLVRALSSGGAIVLHGPGGVGKTHLARVAFDHGAARFRERVWAGRSSGRPRSWGESSWAITATTASRETRRPHGTGVLPEVSFP